MRIAVLGSGGREHALAWRLGAETGDPVFVMPGNAGTPHTLEVRGTDPHTLAAVCLEHQVDLLVVGPEAPLAAGLADVLTARGLRVFGPSAAAARLESSKAWAKDFMRRHGVATARYSVAHGVREAATLAGDGRVVLKYDGLAGGKGVVVCGSRADVDAGLSRLARAHGEEARIVVEERLEGDEVSLVGITDGHDMVLLPPCQDHKALLDGDLGPNTGGMGAFTPVPGCGPRVVDEAVRRVVAPTLAGLAAEGLPFRGALYFGLMITAEGPSLLEYNVRFGDPETEAVLPALKGSLLDLVLAASDGELGRVAPAGLSMAPDQGLTLVDVVLAAEGYPDRPRTGAPIEGLEIPDGGDCRVFHGGTRRDGAVVRVAGGRVLHVVASGPDVASARMRAADRIREIHFDGMHFRSDIGLRRWSSGPGAP
ncbi:MAG: phosphoribosylamine--glycine ligase [Deltaproteobacteria bacterium]|nr:phosphoribosylamine--glycine ligase [Deltaproteobacteria bacterium]